MQFFLITYLFSLHNRTHPPAKCEAQPTNRPLINETGDGKGHSNSMISHSHEFTLKKPQDNHRDRNFNALVRLGKRGRHFTCYAMNRGCVRSVASVQVAMKGGPLLRFLFHSVAQNSSTRVEFHSHKLLQSVFVPSLLHGEWVRASCFSRAFCSFWPKVLESGLLLAILSKGKERRMLRRWRGLTTGSRN